MAESQAVSLVVELDDKPPKPLPPHLQKRLGKAQPQTTPEKIEEKLQSAEQRRKEQQTQRLERMKQREADCRRANEYLGMIPPQQWGKKVLNKALTPLQSDYANVPE